MNAPSDPWKWQFFLDTEFPDFDTCQLISVAIIGEDGRKFYGELPVLALTCEAQRPYRGRLHRAVIGLSGHRPTDSGKGARVFYGDVS
jgi:hypothetical protein